MAAALHDGVAMTGRRRHLDLGESGEEMACRELKRRGYAILARRYRTRSGEIDIVARDGDVLVFVEVKTRTHTACGSPLEAVTRSKQRQVARMALDYVARTGLTGMPCRFDVVGIVMDSSTLRVEVIKDAFGAS